MMTSYAVSFGSVRCKVRGGDASGSPGISGIIRDHPRRSAAQRPVRARAAPQGGAEPRRRLLLRALRERAPVRRLPGEALMRPPRSGPGWEAPLRGAEPGGDSAEGASDRAGERSGWGPGGHKDEDLLRFSLSPAG